MVAGINVDLGVVRWCGTWAACAEIQRCPGIQKGNPIGVGRVGVGGGGVIPWRLGVRVRFEDSIQ